MTVKEAVNVLKTAKTIVLGYGDSVIKLDKNNIFMMDAYGKYCVDKIRAAGDDEYYEIDIAMLPVKVGE